MTSSNHAAAMPSSLAPRGIAFITPIGFVPMCDKQIGGRSRTGPGCKSRTGGNGYAAGRGQPQERGY